MEAGDPPVNETIHVRFNEEGVNFVADFEFSIVTNMLHYDVSLTSQNDAEVFALTLIIDTEEVDGLNESIVLNMLGPNTRQADGQYFMSTEFRKAFEEERVYLRVFADSLPMSGETHQIR